MEDGHPPKNDLQSLDANFGYEVAKEHLNGFGAERQSRQQEPRTTAFLADLDSVIHDSRYDSSPRHTQSSQSKTTCWGR